MRNLKQQILAIAVTAMIGFGSPNTHAGAMAGGSSEVTQILNNVQLLLGLSESVTTNVELGIQTATQIKQLDHDIKNLKRLGSSFGKGNIDSLEREMNALKKINQISKKMTGDLDEFSRELQSRQVEAAKSGLTTDEYVKQQAKLLDDNNTRAALRIENEKRLMESVTEDHKLINEWAAQIPNNEGVQQSMGLLNTQMNRSVQVLSRVSEQLNQQNDNTAKAEQLAKENVDRIRDAKFMTDRQRENNAQTQQMKVFREKLTIVPSNTVAN